MYISAEKAHKDEVNYLENKINDLTNKCDSL